METEGLTTAIFLAECNNPECDKKYLSAKKHRSCIYCDLEASVKHLGNVYVSYRNYLKVEIL